MASHQIKLLVRGDVRADLSAKAMVQTQKMHRMYWPIREQARSHDVWRRPPADLSTKAV